jgi:hypothetical protein
MLENKRIHPSWNEVVTWLKDDRDKLMILREILHHGSLCRVGKDSNLYFRHDRIGESLLAEQIISILKNHPEDEILHEPYFAEMIGRAIIIDPQSEENLEELVNDLPLALFQALKYFGDPKNEYHKKIIRLLEQYLKISILNGNILNSELAAIAQCLLSTDSSSVIELTKDFPSNWPILLARLRNGCAMSGIIYCSRNPFEPGDNFTLRDQIIEHAKLRHGEKIKEDLRTILISKIIPDTIRKGALALVGFFGFTELKNEIAICWDLSSDKKQILTETIWAAARCCEIDANIILDSVMKYWSALSDASGPSGSLSPRLDIASDLKFGMEKGIQDEVYKVFYKFV